MGLQKLGHGLFKVFQHLQGYYQELFCSWPLELNLILHSLILGTSVLAFKLGLASFSKYEFNATVQVADHIILLCPKNRPPREKLGMTDTDD